MCASQKKTSCVFILLLGLLFADTGRCQEESRNLDNHTLLEAALTRAAGFQEGFRLVHFSKGSPSRPRFEPLKGLDQPKAVPFLIDVLRNGVVSNRIAIFQDKNGIYSHVARCYAALCLGAIGDERALEPLIDLVEESDVPETYTGSFHDGRQRYLLSDYSALGLGYLGDSRALGPLVRVLPSRGQRYKYFAFALAQLGDLRATMPLIQHASTRGTMSYVIHRCLEDLTQAHFSVRYISARRTYRIVDFPELGELPADEVYLVLWQHWRREGGEFARKHFEKMYAAWDRRRGKQFTGLSSDERLFKEMTRGGLAALPHVMEKIDQGDASLIPYVPGFVKPVRIELENGKTDHGPKLPKLKTRSDCQAWWQNNQAEYRVDFEAKPGADKNPRT